MAKYTLVLEDQVNGSVAVMVPESTKAAVAAVAAGVEQGSAAFDYLVACLNTCELRSRGISREAEDRVRNAGLVVPALYRGPQ